MKTKIFPSTLEECMKTFDLNQDNKLNIKEFQMLCTQLFIDNEGTSYRLNEKFVEDIFKVFDKDNNDEINSAEFKVCWDKWINVILNPRSALVIIDVQNDFISGSLSIKNCPAKHDGEDIIKPINEMLDSIKFNKVVYSLDWHPENHISFIENVHLRELDDNMKTPKPFDVVLFKENPVEQKLWPTHCIQNSWGSKLHKDLKLVENALKVYKGCDPDIDSYSAFWDNAKISCTILEKELMESNITDVYVCGIATDYCVGFSVLDSIEAGFRTVFVEDSSRGVSLENIEMKKKEIVDKYGVIVSSKDVHDMVNGKDRKPELGYFLAKKLAKESI